MSKRKYKNEEFDKLYQNFIKMYKEEGNIFNSVKESIEEGYEHHMIPDTISKNIVLQILKEASKAVFSEKIIVLNEDEFIKQMDNEIYTD